MGLDGRDARQSLVRAPSAQHGGDRLEDDRDVEPHRPVVEVGEVEADEVVEGETRAARDLPQPGHPGEHETADPVPVVEQLVIA